VHHSSLANSYFYFYSMSFRMVSAMTESAFIDKLQTWRIQVHRH
jgi:hypothetical protein